MKYLRWIHIEDYAIKYRVYIEDKSVDIIEDESIDPKKINPVITVEDESTYKMNPMKTKSSKPKKMNPLSRKK
jgi:hypothetical protein